MDYRGLYSDVSRILNGAIATIRYHENEQHWMAILDEFIAECKSFLGEISSRRWDT